MFYQFVSQSRSDAATKSFSDSVGSTRESRPNPEGGFDLGGGQGPTFDDKPASTLTRSQIDKTREFKEAQKEKRKGLNPAEKFRVNRLKKLYERKVLPQQRGFIPFGAQFAQSLSPPKLNVYDEVDPAFDMSFYGLTGDEITDADRLAKAINKAESTGIISQSEFEDAFFGPEGPPQIDQKDQGIMDPCKGPNPPAYCFPVTISTSVTTILVWYTSTICSKCKSHSKWFFFLFFFWCVTTNKTICRWVRS